MSTQTGAPHILGRVADRAGAGLWRNRGGLVFLGLAALALGGYVAFMSFSGTPVPLASGGLAVADGDCADTAMAAIADKSASATQKAYQ